MPDPEKSPRRLMFEENLAADPTDSFLRYGLALQCLQDGDTQEGQERLKALIADDPDNQIAAYQQLGQSFMDEGDLENARSWFVRGIANAQACGDLKAAGEMQGFLELLG